MAAVIGSQQKQWVNPQSLAELGRTIERMAKVTGVLDTGIDATAGSVSNVQVVLPAHRWTGWSLPMQRRRALSGRREL